MTDITLTPKQSLLANDCIDWYKSPSRRQNQPVYPIPGVAGSGKSTLISILENEFGLNTEQIAYVAYTGMAACVLIRKGLPATTIHKLIYIPFEYTDKETKEKKIGFKLKEKEELAMIRLIIVDEGSMVSDNLMKDLISFGIPIIIVGDPFQLKPVSGLMNDYLYKSEYFLDEPLRQALDNPIIYISDMVRHGKIPKIGTYGDKVRVYSKNSFPEEVLIEANQIIAGRNKTCNYLNKYFRTKFLGFNSKYPMEDDKLICIKNNWALSLRESWLETYMVNGLIGTANNIKFDRHNETFKFDFKPNFMNISFNNVLGDTLCIDDPNCKDEKYVKETFPDVGIARIPTYNMGIAINKYMYAYCITTYKMQGSQARRIAYVDEFLRKDIYLNHFYTGVTRAEEELDIIL